ncbi:hypothetical protein BSIN_1159 [Burkholderia singularis]|uniref:Uncharacterized protein n=1 Tax=Burkholderia singularis TaxID=1503053 RepID=A0A238HD68_9BURK|nr:hypothetical protein BSIN_1159 [Burkholderia singularis]
MKAGNTAPQHADRVTDAPPLLASVLHFHGFPCPVPPATSG